MKTRPTIAILAILASVCSVAQNVKEEPLADPVLEAIQKFNNREKGKPNEVSVVLDDAPPQPAEVKELPSNTDSSQEAAVLVTGKPPEGADVVVPPGEIAADAVAIDLDGRYV